MNILLNFEKDVFENYYYMFGYSIISKIFKNDRYYLEILKLDRFVKFYDFLGHSIITVSFG